MFSPTSLIGLGIIAVAALYLWRSGEYTGRARLLAKHHCQQLGLQFLDDSMVITSLWPMRAASGRLMFRRSYQFEFSSTGDRRYRGTIVLDGLQLRQIELDVYKLPPQDE
jgi:hypothetical protein